MECSERLKPVAVGLCIFVGYRYRLWFNDPDFGHSRFSIVGHPIIRVFVSEIYSTVRTVLYLRLKLRYDKLLPLHSVDILGFHTSLLDNKLLKNFSF